MKIRLSDKSLHVFLLTIFFLSGGCIFHSQCKRQVLTINNINLDVEMAKTSAEKQKGLQKRMNLKENNGMLFVYENPQILSFWMKDTFLPLSIAYIDEHGIITEIHDMEPMDIVPLKSKKKCVYALEVNKGFFKKNNIKEGCIVNELACS